MAAINATAAPSQGSSQALEAPVALLSSGAGSGGAAVTVCGAAANGSAGALFVFAAGNGGGATAEGAVAVGSGVALATLAGRSAVVCTDLAGVDRAVAVGDASVWGRGVAGAVVVAGASSAGRVFVPGRLKFCNSRGPTASVAGVVVLVVAGWVVFWASAAAGRAIAAAANIAFKRKPALIPFRSAWVAVTYCGASAHARPAPPIQAQRR